MPFLTKGGGSKQKRKTESGFAGEGPHLLKTKRKEEKRGVGKGEMPSHF